MSRDAFDVMAERVVALEKITRAMQQHASDLPAGRREFLKFVASVKRTSKAYEAFLIACQTEAERAEIAALNEATNCGLIQ